MISEERTVDEIEEWSDKLEESVRRFEQVMMIIQDAINQWKEKNRASLWEEWKKRKLKIEELQRSIRVSGDQPKEENVKLPNLVISSFTGTHIDFFWFWNQFEIQIDKSECKCKYCVTKLSYLNKMLVPKVQLLFKGLPCNSKGYERAKTILKSTYGKPSQLAKPTLKIS